MFLFGTEQNYGIGLLMDATLCDTRDEKYLFAAEAITFSKWWKNPDKYENTTYQSKSLVALKENLRERNSYKKRPLEYSETMVGINKAALKGIFFQTRTKGVSKANEKEFYLGLFDAIRKKERVKQKLGLDLPIIIINADTGVTEKSEYTLEMQKKDLEDFAKKYGEDKITDLVLAFRNIKAVPVVQPHVGTNNGKDEQKDLPIDGKEEKKDQGSFIQEIKECAKKTMVYKLSAKQAQQCFLIEAVHPQSTIARGDSDKMTERLVESPTKTYFSMINRLNSYTSILNENQESEKTQKTNDDREARDAIKKVSQKQYLRLLTKVKKEIRVFIEKNKNTDINNEEIQFIYAHYLLTIAPTLEKQKENLGIKKASEIIYTLMNNKYVPAFDLYVQKQEDSETIVNEDTIILGAELGSQACQTLLGKNYLLKLLNELEEAKPGKASKEESKNINHLKSAVNAGDHRAIKTVTNFLSDLLTGNITKRLNNLTEDDKNAFDLANNLLEDKHISDQIKIIKANVSENEKISAINLIHILLKQYIAARTGADEHRINSNISFVQIDEEYNTKLTHIHNSFTTLADTNSLQHPNSNLILQEFKNAVSKAFENRIEYKDKYFNDKQLDELCAIADFYNHINKLIPLAKHQQKWRDILNELLGKVHDRLNNPIEQTPNLINFLNNFNHYLHDCEKQIKIENDKFFRAKLEAICKKISDHPKYILKEFGVKIQYRDQLDNLHSKRVSESAGYIFNGLRKILDNKETILNEKDFQFIKQCIDNELEDKKVNSQAVTFCGITLFGPKRDKTTVKLYNDIANTLTISTNNKQ